MSVITLEEIEENKTELVSINTRFGEITVNIKNSIYFPNGLPGFSDRLDFVMADIPNYKPTQFKLLQSLSDYSLSFIVLPIDTENSFIESQDISECCQQLDIKLNDLLTLIIISVQRTPEDSKILANFRAPIFIDVKRKVAMQYIFPNDKYSMRHVLV